MQCNEWNNEWVCHLYGELEADEAGRLELHLATCEACAERLDGLQRSRDWIRRGEADLPSAPRVVVLDPRRSWSSAWSFAGGAACALLLFGSGFMIASQRSGGSAEIPLRVDSRPTSDAAELADLRTELASLSSRLDSVEGNPANQSAHQAAWKAEMQQLERRVQGDRAKDLEFVIESLTATELRTGNWIDRTEDVLTMIALRQDPSVREH